MYPPSLFWWIGGTVVLIAIIGLIGMLALAVDHWYQRHIEKHHDAPRDEDGRSGLWYVFEVLSAVFVVTALLTMIYSDSQLLRAIGGTLFIVVVSAAAAVYVRSEK